MFAVRRPCAGDFFDSSPVGLFLRNDGVGTALEAMEKLSDYPTVSCKQTSRRCRLFPSAIVYVGPSANVVTYSRFDF